MFSIDRRKRVTAGTRELAVRRWLKATALGALVLGIAGLSGVGEASSAQAATSPPAMVHGTGGLVGTGPKVAALSQPVILASGAPSSVDLRQWSVPVGNQGGVNSCATWAIDYALLGWYSRHDGKAGQPFAPMYTYSQVNGGTDSGAYGEDVLKLAVSQGSDTRADYTQGDYDWSDQPTSGERLVAGHYRIPGYHTLFANATDQGPAATIQLRQALMLGHPVVVAFHGRDGFKDLPSGAVYDNVTTPKLYMHEMLAVGYDASGVLVQNSWGTGWSSGGFGRISWRVVEKDFYEAFTIDGFASPGGHTDLGGAITSPPSVVTPTPTHQDIYYRGPNNHLFVSSHDSGGWWSAPTDLGGVALTSGPSAVTPTPTHTDVYYRGPNNHLFVSSHENGGFWSAPYDLGGVALSSSPSAVTPTSVNPLTQIPMPSTHTDVYYEGPNGHLFVSSHDNGGFWGAPHDLGGVALSSSPSAVATSLTHTDVYYRGPSNHLFVSSHDTGGWWSAPTDLGGNLSSAPGVVAGLGLVTDVYYRGAANHLFVTPHLAGYPWGAPEDLNGALASAPAVARISDVANVFYRGANGHLWVATW